METNQNSDIRQKLLGKAFQSKIEHSEMIKVLKKEEIMKRQEARYQKYFKQWRDFDMLTTILAMIGLILAIVEVKFISYLFSSKSQKNSVISSGQ